MAELKRSMYHVGVPGLQKFDTSRTTHSMPVQCPHECIDREFRDQPRLLQEVERMKDQGLFPPNFYKHPAVQGTRSTVVPLELYLDGISFTRNDGILGVFFYSVLTKRRFLFAAVRRSFPCKCGCKGWCTLFPLFSCLRWSLAALAAGRWPSSKHDNTSWSDVLAMLGRQ